MQTLFTVPSGNFIKISLVKASESVLHFKRVIGTEALTVIHNQPLNNYIGRQDSSVVECLTWD